MGDTAAMTSGQASGLQDAAMATSVFSTIGSTISSVGAIKAQGSYQTSLANTNAAMAKLKAAQTLQAGDLAASRQNLKTQSAIGTSRAMGGASGVDVNSGSEAMSRESIGTIGAIDESTIRNNAARAAWGYQTQVINDTFEGQFAGLTAKSKTFQTLATGGLAAISAPLAMKSQAALWQFRYGLKGQAGQPFPSNGSTATSSDDSDFWGNA